MEKYQIDTSRKFKNLTEKENYFYDVFPDELFIEELKENNWKLYVQLLDIAKELVSANRMSVRQFETLFEKPLSKASFEPDYLVRKDKQGTYLVTKWEGGEQPSAVYTVTEGNRGLFCNCPGSFRDKNCKHIQLVKEHMKNPKVESAISSWSQDGNMSSYTKVMRTGPMVKCLIFDNSNKQNLYLSKPNEVVVELHFMNKQVFEARDFSWKNIEVLKKACESIAEKIYKESIPKNEETLKRLVQSEIGKLGREITEAELVQTCAILGIEIKNNQISKADVELLKQSKKLI